MKKHKLVGIQQRMLEVNTTFILLAFVLAIGVFNIAVRYYVQREATQQLSSVLQYAKNTENTDASENTPNNNFGNAPRGVFNIHANSFKLNKDYSITTANETAPIDERVAQQIADELKHQQKSLAHISNYRLVTGNHTFYLDSYTKGDNVTILYVDVSGILNFTTAVNWMLMLIATIVVALTSAAVTWITGRVIKPLTALVHFAEQIGRGRYPQLQARTKIRELDSLSESMNQMTKRLKQNDETQQIFFQNASHELRTPLMVIKSYAEGIKYEIMDPQEATTIINQEVDRMTELVEDLLTVSRLDSLQDKEKNQVDLRKMLADIHDEQKLLAEQKQLEFVLETAKKPIQVVADDKALRKAISNLVSNALRYAKHKITMSCRQTEDSIEVAVTNDGPMIKPEALDHLFERFYKGEGGNHGIGLAMVKTIVEQHQGNVTATSDENETKFIITLPLSAPERS